MARQQQHRWCRDGERPFTTLQPSGAFGRAVPHGDNGRHGIQSLIEPSSREVEPRHEAILVGEHRAPLRHVPEVVTLTVP